MKKFNVIKRLPAGMTRTVGMAVLKTKKNSPHIFFAAGVVGVVGTTVLACRATLKLEKELDQIKTELDDLKQFAEVTETMSEADYRKDVGTIALKGGGRIIKLYAPAVVIGVASVAALTGSHVQMTRRNAALTATLGLVSKAFEDYRERVRQELGEKKESDVYRGVREEMVEVDGKKQKQLVVDEFGRSPYAVCFDDFSTAFNKSHEINLCFLVNQQAYFNQRLRHFGYVFLNDVYEALGFPKTSAGQVVGWIYESDRGDGHIDFNLDAPENERFQKGYEWSCWLDFNVDGVMYDQIS